MSNKGQVNMTTTVASNAIRKNQFLDQSTRVLNTHTNFHNRVVPPTSSRAALFSQKQLLINSHNSLTESSSNAGSAFTSISSAAASRLTEASNRGGSKFPTATSGGNCLQNRSHSSSTLPQPKALRTSVITATASAVRQASNSSSSLSSTARLKNAKSISASSLLTKRKRTADDTRHTKNKAPVKSPLELQKEIISKMKENGEKEHVDESDVRWLLNPARPHSDALLNQYSYRDCWSGRSNHFDKRSHFKVKDNSSKMTPLCDVHKCYEDEKMRRKYELMCNNLNDILKYGDVMTKRFKALEDMPNVNSDAVRRISESSRAVRTNLASSQSSLLKITSENKLKLDYCYNRFRDKTRKVASVSKTS